MLPCARRLRGCRPRARRLLAHGSRAAAGRPVSLQLPPAGPQFAVYELSILALQQAMAEGRVTSPTTAGSITLAGVQPYRDASVTARLRAAGAVLLGKTNMMEFALGITTVSSLGG